MEQNNNTPALPAQQAEEEAQYLIRSGGLPEGFYVSESVFTCFPQEGKRFSLDEANQIVKQLTQEGKYNTWGTPGLSVRPYSKYM